jgi:hypothetical protein
MRNRFDIQHEIISQTINPLPENIRLEKSPPSQKPILLPLPDDAKF